MIRYFVIAPVCYLFLCNAVAAQEWARKTFETTQHDFGAVARGVNSEYEFVLTNIFKEDIHIASVRASCGCATPTITKPWLKTWEKGSIHVRYNTDRFLGARGATITVVIDRPYYAEVQLSIKGFIRGDVVVQPGAIQFGSVDEGKVSEQTVDVSCAGRTNWQIMDVRSANTNFEVEMSELHRGAGRVGYRLLVRLRDSMPTGYFTDQMVLVTNDRTSQKIPVKIEGQIKPALTVSPASLSLGVLTPGQTVTKRLVVRAKSPFRIKKVQCKDNCFEFKATDEVKKMHLVPVTFTASASGKIVQRIQILTDIGHGSVGTVTAMATVREPNLAAEQNG